VIERHEKPSSQVRPRPTIQIMCMVLALYEVSVR